MAYAGQLIIYGLAVLGMLFIYGRSRANGKVQVPSFQPTHNEKHRLGLQANTALSLVIEWSI